MTCAKFRPQNKRFACILASKKEMKNSSIISKTVPIQDISTEGKQLAESNDNIFSNLKVERKKYICGFACKRFMTGEKTLLPNKGFVSILLFETKNEYFLPDSKYEE